MSYGLPGSVKTELAATQFALPVYCVRITRKNDTQRWAEQSVTFNDGTGSQAYTARLKSLTGMDYSVGELKQVSITVANIDGAVTTLDRSESFAGAKFEVIAYLPGINEYFIPWAGWCDEITELSQEHATITAYASTAVLNVQIPKRAITLQCNWEFGNTANYVNEKNFEGSECPYQRVSTVGFTATLEGALDATTDPVTFNAVWSSAADTAGAQFKQSDVIKIGTEQMLITNSPGDPDVNHKQSLTVSRGYGGTTKATHADLDTILYANCLYSVDACTRRGMFGNNSSDAFSGRNRNYFGGFPFITGYQSGRFVTQRGGKATPLRVPFNGNESAYGSALPLVYGRCRISAPILMVAKAEGDFLSTLWAVAEGLLATNASDDSQTTTENAYTNGHNGIFVNGVTRHDQRFPNDIYNGQMDQPEPGVNFFPSGAGQIDDFIINRLGFWGTARVGIRINTKNNPSVDVSGQSVTGAMDIAYGRVHRVYSDTSTHVKRATANGSTAGTNGAWVLMDVMTSKRGGGGLDHGRLNIQSFIDVAAHCDTNVTSTFDGSTVKRWTFNGLIDQRKSFAEWVHLISLSMYCLPPFVDKDGKLKIKALKSETLSGLPVFSSSVASSARNILWDGSRSSLNKFRRPVSEIPNEIRGNFVDRNDYARVTLIIADREAQRDLGKKLGDQSSRVISKSVDLPGVTTQDEAARILTLILRAGEYGKGGLSNNLMVRFRCFYRDACDLEIGDVIEVEDDLLNSNERYFRVVSFSDMPIAINDGGFAFAREVEAVLHANAIYDDKSLTVTRFDRIDAPDAFDAEPPAVTGFSVTETGAFDGNNIPVSMLTFAYTEPSPKKDFKSVVILRSKDLLGVPDGKWDEVIELFNPGTTITYPVTGDTEWFAAVSKSLSDLLPDVNTFLADGVTYKYPRVSLLVDGINDAGLCSAISPTVSIKTSATDIIGGNELRVEWQNPTTNATTLWGFLILVHDASTLPSITKVDTGTAGALVAGTAVLTDATKSWTVNAYANKFLTVFDPARSGTPSWEWEGLIILAKITSNTATTITFETPNPNVRRDLTSLRYAVIDGSELYWNKVRYMSKTEMDQNFNGVVQVAGAARTRQYWVPAIGNAPNYVWVVLCNMHGVGPAVAASPVTPTGIREEELKDSAVSTPKLVGTAAGNGAVTAIKTNVVNLGDITLSLGTVQTGLLRTASSGARVELDSTNGFRAFSGAALRTQIPVSGAAGDVLTTVVQGLTNGVSMQSNNGSQAVVVDNTKITLASTGGVDSSTAGSMAFASGQGIKDSGTNSAFVVTSTVAQVYANTGTQVAEFGTGNLKLYVNGGFRTVLVDAADLGSGTKNYLYY